MADIFMSYAREDRAVAVALVPELESQLEQHTELETCGRRAGEGVTAYINRVPTYRHLARAEKQFSELKGQ